MSNIPLERIKAVRDRVLRAAKDELQRGEISALDLLAILAYTTGACLAWQDQRKITAQQAIDLVEANIAAGNREVVDELKKAFAGSA